jgi:hypothetical protein
MAFFYQHKYRDNFFLQKSIIGDYTDEFNIKWQCTGLNHIKHRTRNLMYFLFYSMFYVVQ